MKSIKRTFKSCLALQLLFQGAVSLAPAVLAHSPGSFTTTGGMSTPRMSHTATLLPNGKVLIAGGWRYGTVPTVWATAELYDPATGAFSLTGSMTTKRVGHTATLLADGRVLIAGGCAGRGALFFSVGTPLSSAEIYDPDTGTFAPAGNMTAARCWFVTSTLLADGRILIAGGREPSADLLLTSAEIYDPHTGAFTATGRRTSSYVANPSATLLPNGTVLVQGSDIYDPVAGAFRSTSQSEFGTATLLHSGKVLLAGGGLGDYGENDFAALYSPSDGRLTRTGTMVTARSGHTATLLPDGNVFLTGRDWPTSAPRAELYVSAEQSFVPIGDMVKGRTYHTATLLNSGRILIAGGITADYEYSAELYQPATLTLPPALLSRSGDGRGQGAILHPGTREFASPTNPASAGEALEIYLTGLAAGSVIPPQVIIGGRMAELLYFGPAPGWPGLNQVNARVPSGISPGPAVPVRLTYLARSSNEVTIGVR